jgi:PhnB protein
MEPTRKPKLAPYLTAKDAPGLVRFIETGIGGRVTLQQADEAGTLQHVEMKIADSLVMLAETPQGRPNYTAMLHLYVRDADAAYDRALAAGATSVRPPGDAPDGDRRGGVRDSWGNEWWFTRLPRDA